MVDYIAIEKVEGLTRGAKLAGISVCGGETAQLKGMVKGFDLTGTAIGHVPLDKIVVGEELR